MKVEKNIKIAFLLNLFFSIFEIIGGLFTNSFAILSDAIHDFADAFSIGISYILEKKSRQKPNDEYTYGYKRYSILGALITTVILLVGSILIIYHSIERIFNPVDINHDGMFVIAIVGVVINFFAVYFTRDGDSLNQKAVNLHLLEDVFGWVIVLVGSIIIKFTRILWIDSAMSIGVSIFIFVHAIEHLQEVLDLFLIKKPKEIDIEEVKNNILNIDGVKDVHHLHIWSLDGINNFATLHVVTEKNVKKQVREEMQKFGINNVTIETEDLDEECHEKKCHFSTVIRNHHHHHHHKKN